MSDTLCYISNDEALTILTKVERENLFHDAEKLKENGCLEDAACLYFKCVKNINNSCVFPSLPLCLKSLALYFFEKNNYTTALQLINALNQYYQSALNDSKLIHLKILDFSKHYSDIESKPGIANDKEFSKFREAKQSDKLGLSADFQYLTTLFSTNVEKQTDIIRSPRSFGDEQSRNEAKDSVFDDINEQRKYEDVVEWTKSTLNSDNLFNFPGILESPTSSTVLAEEETLLDDLLAMATVEDPHKRVSSSSNVTSRQNLQEDQSSGHNNLRSPHGDSVPVVAEEEEHSPPDGAVSCSLALPCSAATRKLLRNLALITGLLLLTIICVTSLLHFFFLQDSRNSAGFSDDQLYNSSGNNNLDTFQRMFQLLFPESDNGAKSDDDKYFVSDD